MVQVDDNQQQDNIAQNETDPGAEEFAQAAAMAEEEAKKQRQQQKAKGMVPMSKEQYEAEQSKVREVYDEESGRYRLVRGSGEIIERIVSQSDHARINQAATRGDGASFSRSIFHASSGGHRHR